LWYAGGGAAIPQSAASETPRVSEPVSHANLTVYFIHGPDTITSGKIATLQEALEAGWAVVHEIGAVNTLAVENRSDEYELFIQEGDMIRGGKQDRMIAVDMLIPPKSGRVSFPVNCVEHDRWQGRGNEAATHFSKSDHFAVGNNIRYANATYQQTAVWASVKENQDKLSDNLGVKVNAAESASSFQLALENKDLQAKVAEFEQALRAAGEAEKDVIGVVFVLNGQVMGHEEYGSNALFEKAWPKLLRSVAANAVVEKSKRPITSVPSASDIEVYLARGPGERKQEGAGGVEGIPIMDIEFVNDQSPQIAGIVTMRPSPDDEARRRQVADRLRARSRQVTPTSAAQDSIIMGGSGAARVNEEMILPNPDEALNPAGNVQQRVVASADGTALIGGMAPTGNALPANVEGNRLTVNKVNTGTGLTSEARDPARQNAVIHKSSIKLSEGITSRDRSGGTMIGR
jgi:hypothetical protein